MSDLPVSALVKQQQHCCIGSNPGGLFTSHQAYEISWNLSSSEIQGKYTLHQVIPPKILLIGEEQGKIEQNYINLSMINLLYLPNQIKWNLYLS